MQPLMEEPDVAKQRRKAGAELTRVAHVVRIQACRVRAAMRQPREHDRREGWRRAGAIVQRRLEEPHYPLRVYGEVRAAPPCTLHHPRAVRARTNELHGIQLDG